MTDLREEIQALGYDEEAADEIVSHVEAHAPSEDWETGTALSNREYKEVLNAGRALDCPWDADNKEYAVFPGKLAAKANAIGDVEDILWESEEWEIRRYLLVALDEPLHNYRLK